MIVQVSLAQRAKWKFQIAPFDLYFVCSTQSSIEQSMALCEANCRAGENQNHHPVSNLKIETIVLFFYPGACTDRSTERTLNLEPLATQRLYGSTCNNSNFNQNILGNAAYCSTIGFSQTSTVCPPPADWNKSCPVNPTCCVSNHAVLPESDIVPTGSKQATEVRILSTQLRVGYSTPLARPLGISMLVTTEV